MKTVYLFFIGLTTLSFAASAQADVIFSIDLDTTQAGIQNSRTLGSGESFTAALVLQVTGTSRIAAFSLGLDYDNSELIATAVDVSGRAAGFGQVNNATISNTFSPTVGRVRPFDAISLGTVLENFTGNIGLISFTGVTPTTDGGIDLIGAFQTGVDDVLDADTFLVIPRDLVIFNGASINVSAVPEPTTWLFGTVLAGFGVKRIRKRIARKSRGA